MTSSRQQSYLNRLNLIYRYTTSNQCHGGKHVSSSRVTSAIAGTAWYLWGFLVAGVDSGGARACVLVGVRLRCPSRGLCTALS
jgi:hypothetical protein